MELTLGSRDFILLNIKSGEMLKLNCKYELINEIVELLFKEKYFPFPHPTSNTIESSSRVDRKCLTFGQIANLLWLKCSAMIS